MLHQRKNHKERLKLLKETVDEDGNLYSFNPEDSRVFLRKKNTREDIPIGKVLMGERNLLYHKFEDERNIFRNTQAWSINYKIFENIDYIIYETLKKVYMIPRERATEFGEQVNFQQERKINIPIIYWDVRNQLIDETEKRRRNLLGDSWYELLSSVINSDYMSKIGSYLRKRRTEAIIYPEESVVFRAFKLTHTKQVKVIILGQDPYHDGSANGLAFGFKDGWKEGQKGVTLKPLPKSLDVIFREVERDVYNGLHLDFDATLDSWAKQGVLLLNTILTVERGKPKSHEGYGWQRFIKIVLFELLKDIQPKVFLLWGNDANLLFGEVRNKLKEQNIEAGPSLILSAKHPAADLYSQEWGAAKADYPHTFAGNGHFSLTNKFLREHKRNPITW